MNRNFTKEEAQRIFSLAAERQQAKQRESDGQLSIADLEEAGVAAGIDPEYIRAAAGDLLRPERATEQRNFMGFPVELRESHVLSLAFDEEKWKKSVDIFTHVYGKAGKTMEVGTTHRWQSEQNDNQMPVSIIAEKEEHGTRFTIERKMWPMTLGFGIGAGVNLLMGLIFTMIWLTTSVSDELIIPGTIMMSIGLLMGLFGSIGMKIYGRRESKRFEEIFDHLEKLAEASDSNKANATLVDPHKEALTEPLISLDSEADLSEDPARVRSRSGGLKQ
ncbi:MAG: hypothetical protein AB8G77_08185 [Rhodothermales bacterium]